MSIFVEIFMVGSENFVYFCRTDVSTVQGHPRSLIFGPIVGEYVTSYVTSR